METKETILAKLNTSPDRLTELVEQDGFYFVRKEITREQYPVIKQFYEYQQQSPSPAIVTIYSVYEKEGHFFISMKNGFVGKAWRNTFICKVHFQKMK